MRGKKTKPFYSKFTAYLFMNFLVMGVGFGIMAPLVMKDKGAGVAMMMIGIPSFLVAFLIAASVVQKAKRRGIEKVLGLFVIDSLLVFAKVLLCVTIIMIPLVKYIVDGSSWEERKLKNGRSILVKSLGGGEYVDRDGNRYVE